MSTRVASILRLTLLAVLAAAALVSGMPRASEYDEQVLSFDMWCLEMQLYPMNRCDARRPQDVKDYQQYRTAWEQYQQQRAARAKRERDLKQRLDRDPLGARRDPFAKPPG